MISVDREIMPRIAEIEGASASDRVDAWHGLALAAAALALAPDRLDEAIYRLGKALESEGGINPDCVGRYVAWAHWFRYEHPQDVAAYLQALAERAAKCEIS